MKTIVSIIAGLMFVASMSFAADAVNTDSSESKTTTNPITGTKKTVVKKKKKVKAGDSKSEAEVTETTKVKKDGSTETAVEVDATAKEEKK